MEILRSFLALSVYIIVIAMLFILKPDAMFRSDGSIKEVGFTTDNRSLLSLYVVAPLIALFIYIITIATF